MIAWRAARTSDAGRRRALGELFDEVVAARDRERSQSGARGGSEAVRDARVRTLRALVDYADLIESFGWPVPRVVHMDIMLRRSLCGPMAERLFPSAATGAESRCTGVRDA